MQAVDEECSPLSLVVLVRVGAGMTGLHGGPIPGAHFWLHDDEYLLY